MTSPAVGIRARNRAALEAEILAAGRRHLAEHGAAALSLRAIARDLGMASSAVYRYVASRDELLTLLIVEAYDSLGDAVDNAVAGQVDPLERFRIIGRATRTWAAAHPHQFTLVYGSPVPGYQAPAERTVEPGTRVVAHLIGVLAELAPSWAGAAPDERAERALAGLIADPTMAGLALPPVLLSRGLAAWALVLGSITAERFGHYGPDSISDPDAHFEGMLDLAAGLVTAS